MSNIRFVNKGAKNAEIWLYDQVGDDGWGSGMSAKNFIQQLNALGQVDSINLRVNSPGGSVFEGWAIYNALSRHPANIIVDVDSMAASIASVIAMAGDEIRMAENSMMMIHNPAGFTAGGADDMRKTADLLDQIKSLIVNTYTKRTGASDADVIKMMDDETWMTAVEAQEMGFADSVTEEQRIAASYAFDFSRFKNAPSFLVPGSRPKRDQFAVKFAAMDKRIAG